MANLVAELVSDILRRRNRGIELRPELPLGSGGLGLDSVALVEVLLECEEAFGITLAAEMLDAPAFTVGSLVERIQAVR